MTENKRYRIFLSAAEPSADSHCAKLIRRLKALNGDFEFVGVGGDEMKSAGCELLFNTAGRAAMLYNAIGHIWRFYKMIRSIRGYLRANRPDLVIVCDSPAFNFHVAKAARKAGLKTMFYVAPQLWAWGGWRIGKLRKNCDRLACLLPFEQRWFGERGIKGRFVGNPLFEDLGFELDGVGRDYANFKAENAEIAILPGSRSAEIETLWPAMQQVAIRLKEKYSAARFVAVAVDEEKRQELEKRQIAGFECEYTIRTVPETARRCDLTIVASGSATLQVAAAACPMVVMYQSNRFVWHIIGRWLIKSRFLSLVNILAGKELVPEFMPYFKSVEPIADACVELLDDSGRMAQMSFELASLSAGFKDKNASEQVALMAVEMIGVEKNTR